MTYSELVEASVGAARRLRAAGIKHGDCVAFLVADVSADYVALLLGTLRLGAVAATLNARAKVRD